MINYIFNVGTIGFRSANPIQLETSYTLTIIRGKIGELTILKYIYILLYFVKK